MKRRSFLHRAALAGGAVFTGGLRAEAADPEPAPDSPSLTRVLDTHIHLFDIARPGGVPWPLPTDPIYRPSLPARYQALARPLHIVGAIAIEASPLKSDNDWLLRTVEASPFMVGMIGDLPPSLDTFATDLDRFSANPLFLGIRHGNLWNRDLAIEVKGPGIWPALRHLQQAGLVFETANPNRSLLTAVLQVVEKMPDLTVVVDHLPHMAMPSAPGERQELKNVLGRLAQAPHVAIKLSEIPSVVDGKVVRAPAFYRDRLDELWSLFGPARAMFGSDWPNSDTTAPIATTMSIVEGYMNGKSAIDKERFYFANSQTIYRWKPRRPDQS